MLRAGNIALVSEFEAANQLNLPLFSHKLARA
jgi:hypothetical protein